MVNIRELINGRTEEQIKEDFKEIIFNIDYIDFKLIFGMYKKQRFIFIYDKEKLFNKLINKLSLLDIIIFTDKHEELKFYKEELKIILENLNFNYYHLKNTFERAEQKMPRFILKNTLHLQNCPIFYEEARRYYINNNLKILLKRLKHFIDIKYFLLYFKNPNIRGDEIFDIAEDTFLKYR